MERETRPINTFFDRPNTASILNIRPGHEKTATAASPVPVLTTACGCLFDAMIITGPPVVWSHFLKFANFPSCIR